MVFAHAFDCFNVVCGFLQVELTSMLLSGILSIVILSTRFFVYPTRTFPCTAIYNWVGFQWKWHTDPALRYQEFACCMKQHVSAAM